MSYHVNPKTGRASVCRARVRCPFGGSDEHYSSEKEAGRAFEEKMQARTLPSAVSKKAGDVRPTPSRSGSMPTVSKSTIDEVSRVQTEGSVRRFFKETELSDQFSRDSVRISRDGSIAQARAEYGFSYNRVKVSSGDVVTFNSDMRPTGVARPDGTSSSF